MPWPPELNAGRLRVKQAQQPLNHWFLLMGDPAFSLELVAAVSASLVRLAYWTSSLDCMLLSQYSTSLTEASLPKTGWVQQAEKMKIKTENQGIFPSWEWGCYFSLFLYSTSELSFASKSYHGWPHTTATSVQA